MIYRVVFSHARHRTTFETVVHAKDMDAALVAGEAILAERIGATAGQPTGWSHAETITIQEERRETL